MQNQKGTVNTLGPSQNGYPDRPDRSHRHTYEDMLVTVWHTPKPHGIGYHYTVTTRGFTSHTAFFTRESLLRWADQRGLRFEQDVPHHEDVERTDRVNIEGTYHRESHMSLSSFLGVQPSEQSQMIRELSNGSYTLGLVTVEPNGDRVVHHCNPNVPDRPKFDYQESARLCKPTEDQ